MDTGSSTIVVVGESPEQADALRAALSDQFGVETATPSAALEGIEEGTLGGVVCGYAFSDRDGVEFVRGCRERDPDLPVVVVTGAGDESVAAAAIAAGANEYVPTDDPGETVLERVTTAVEAGRERRVQRERARRSRAFEETGPYALVAVTADQTIQFVDEQFEELFGYPREEAIGAKIQHIVPDDFVVRHHHAFGTYLETGVRHLDWGWTELVGERKDGTEFPIGVTLAETGQGQERLFVALVRELETADEDVGRFRKHRAFSESVFENATEVLLLVDPEEYVVREANPGASDTLRYDRGQLRDRPLAELFEDADLARDLVANAGSVADRSELLAATAGDGERVLLDASASMMETPGGRDSASRQLALVTAVDVTERIQREEELRQRNERLDRFTSMVSHDLRNPLNGAKVNADLVARGHDERIEEVEENLETMEQLIEDMLEFAREGEMVSATESVSLARVAEAAWEDVAAGAENVRLKVDGDRTLEADRERLVQALGNLYRNALEHGREDEEPLVVRVGTTDDGFYVEDDGTGIPPGRRESIFEAGYTTDERGTGYGLSIVARIVEGHGWSIRAASSEAGGARFEVTV